MEGEKTRVLSVVQWKGRGTLSSKRSFSPSMSPEQRLIFLENRWKILAKKVTARTYPWDIINRCPNMSVFLTSNLVWLHETVLWRCFCERKSSRSVAAKILWDPSFSPPYFQPFPPCLTCCGTLSQQGGGRWRREWQSDASQGKKEEKEGKALNFCGRFLRQFPSSFKRRGRDKK